MCNNSFFSKIKSFIFSYRFAFNVLSLFVFILLSITFYKYGYNKALEDYVVKRKSKIVYAEESYSSLELIPYGANHTLTDETIEDCTIHVIDRVTFTSSCNSTNSKEFRFSSDYLGIRYTDINNKGHNTYSLYSNTDNVITFNSSLPCNDYYSSSSYVVSKNIYGRIYYDSELLLDTYTQYVASDNNIISNIQSFDLDFIIVSSSGSIWKFDYFGASILFSSISILESYIPQKFSFEFYFLSNSNLNIMSSYTLGSYASSGHIDDLDSYNVGYVKGYEDGVNDTLENINIEDISYNKGYEYGYSLGYRYALANQVVSTYNFVSDFDYIYERIYSFTDSVNNYTLLSDYYYVLGLSLNLSMPYPVRSIKSFSINLNSKAIYHEEDEYDGDLFVDGHIYCYSSTLGTSFSSPLFVPYELTDSSLHYDIDSYNSFAYDALEMHFGDNYGPLLLDNLVLSNGEICSSYNDFVDYNINHYFGSKLAKLGGSSSEKNQLKFYFIFSTFIEDYSIEDLISRMTFSVKFDDDTTHNVESYNWLPDLFRSSNSYINFKSGYELGHKVGFDLGEKVGLTNSELLKDTMFAVMDSPFHLLKQVLNFEILGINLWQIFTGIISVLIVVMLFKWLR